MQSELFQNEGDIQAMRQLIKCLGARSTVVDFEEKLHIQSVRATMRLWRDEGTLVGFAFIDDFDNLWFECDPALPDADPLQSEMIAWGVHCMQARNLQDGPRATLDHVCRSDNEDRIRLLEQHGFESLDMRSLQYERSLHDPVQFFPLPAGFTIRSVHGPQEVEALVALHRAAFGTDHMTIEERLAMMNTPLYQPDLDLVAVASDSTLAAFCVCGFDDEERTIGYTDPVGTHPRFQHLGLAQAILSAGLNALQKAGAKSAGLGTSSQNLPMQRLAEKLGFVCVADKRWFSLEVT